MVLPIPAIALQLTGIPGPSPLEAFLRYCLLLVIGFTVIATIYGYLDGRRGYQRRLDELQGRVDRLEDEHS